MKEQSHKHEMRAALRGDFERLRARRGGETGLVAVAPEPELDPEPDPEPDREPEPAPATATGGSWLDRLRGRA